MPQTQRPSLTELAQKFCAIHRPTKSQELMIGEGLPAAAILDPVERKDSWKGRKLTRPATALVVRKTEDPATIKLRKELAAAEAQKKAERIARRNELKAQTRKAATPAATQETTMATKTSKKTAVRSNLSKALGRPLTEKKATKADRAKKGAKAPARTNPARVAKPAPAKAGSKAPKTGGRKAEVIGMMKRPDGVTVAQIGKATGMLPHSARALISGIGKTEKVTTAKGDDKITVYKIA